MGIKINLRTLSECQTVGNEVDLNSFQRLPAVATSREETIQIGVNKTNEIFGCTAPVMYTACLFVPKNVCLFPKTLFLRVLG